MASGETDRRTESDPFPVRRGARANRKRPAMLAVVRARFSPLLVGLLLLVIARGCYSSIASEASVGVEGEDDSGTTNVPPEAGPDACAPQRPWEGVGITGLLCPDGVHALFLSGDRYYEADFMAVADAGDSSVGHVIAWHNAGLLKDIWSDAPSVIGLKPWGDPGVTAAYVSKTGYPVVINRFRRWSHDATGWDGGIIVDEWFINDAGPPPVDGAVPWSGDGVTAAYFAPGGASFQAISKDIVWTRDTTAPDPANWTWVTDGGTYRLADIWASAPPVGGQKPYEGRGVTAAYYLGGKYFVFSGDKMWALQNGNWAESGMLKDMPGWTSAPTSRCP